MQLLAVIELFPTRMLGAFCVAFGVACVAVAVGCILSEQLQRWASGLAAKFLALSPLNKAVLVLALAVSTVCAQKSGTNEVERLGGGGQSNQESKRLCSPSTSDFDYSTQTVTPADIARGWQVWEVRTNETGFAMPANAVRNEDWFRFGGHSMFDFVGFGEGWTFPYGTQELARVTAMEDGGLRVALSRTEDEIRAVPCPLAALPHQSQFGHTTNGQNRVFAWQGFFSGGDTGAVISASVELRGNGDFVTRSNAVETLCRRIEPFDYDGDGLPNGSDARPCFYDGDCYGQSDEWVRANFTNAEEILSVGYPQWVDAQVGVGLENGLYRLTATFPEAPRRTTLLSVGDLSVCVTNAGEYVFLLEKGVDYAFGTAPFEPTATYRAEDDLPRRRLLGVAEDEGGDWLGWTVDWRPLWIELPRVDRIGHLCWMPYFTVSPAVRHQGLGEPPQSFTAYFGDFVGDRSVRYRWTCEDTNVVFTAANSNETDILLREMPDWRETRIVAHAFFGTNEFTSVSRFHYGRHRSPQVTLSLSVPEVVFLNDDDRASRWYRVEVGYKCPVETNAVVEIFHAGNTGVIFADDADGAVAISWADVQRRVSSLERNQTIEFYFACTNIASGSFTATCAPADGDARTTIGDYNVIEPLRKLVCNEESPGGYYNPSRLVYGTNAWLKVGVNGSFNASNVWWRVVSGPGRIVSRDDWAVSVEATATSGEVVVEAAFGSDSPIQPQFVLPIVTNRRVSVFACVAAAANGRFLITQQDIEQRLDFANRVYSQAGIEFYLAEPVVYLTNSQFSVIAEHNVGTNAAGRTYYYGIHPDVTNLLAQVNSSADIKMFWVDRIVNGTPLAFTLSSRRSCIYADNPVASQSVVPHEIGHAMGLKDIYNRLKSVRAGLLPDGDLPLSSFHFLDVRHDWGLSDGRGFYERVDTHGRVIRLFLMNGFDSGGCDLPCSSVEGYSSSSRNIFDTAKIKIGLSNMRED